MSPGCRNQAIRRVVLCSTACLIVISLNARMPGIASRGKTSSEKGQLAADAMLLLQRNCLGCHNAEKHKGALQMTRREALLQGGDNGPALVSGAPEKSLILTAVQPDADPHMPPKKQLTAKQMDLLRHWIKAGAPWDDKALAKAAAPRVIHPGPLPKSFLPVYALALSPQEDRLAVGRGDHIVVHDVTRTNLPVLLDFQAHHDLVRALAWSPDGQFLASGAFRELTVWRVSHGEREWTAASNVLDRVNVIRFAPDGESIVIGHGGPAQTGWVKVFKAADGRAEAAWEAHGDSLLDLSISFDGRMLATAGADGLVKLWEIGARREIARLEGHIGPVSGVAFNTNASEVMTVGADKQFKIWDTRTKESVVAVSAKKGSFNALAYAANGNVVVAVADDGRMTSYSDFKRHSGAQSSETAKEKQLGQWTESLHAVAVTRDGKRAYTGAQDGVVYVVNSDGKQIAKLEPDTVQTVFSAPRKAGSLGRKLQNTTSKVPRRAEPDGSSPSFVRDILPVLSKAGCAAGACHAKPEGQSGFKLSIFNYDPKSDHAEIVKEGRGRRVFPAAPEESLLLLKPTMGVDHGGGLRIEPESETFRLLARWIREGMVYQHPDEPVLDRISVEPRERTYARRSTEGLKVKAHYSDGSNRDVTRLAEYVSNEKELVQVDEAGVLRVGNLSGESVVIARYLGLIDVSRVTVPTERKLPAKAYARLPAHNFVDTLAYAHFRKMGLFPSELCSDAEFLRRASLDTLGRLASAVETRAFLSDTARDKRARVVERLLSDPAFGDYWANKWADLLRPNPDRVGVKSVYLMDQWLRESFRANKPYDQFVRELLLAEGNNHRDAPVVLYRDRREPPELTTLVSQVFLGTRMECAKCHHHPNEKWSQNDFYQFAAFFGSLKQKGAGLSPPISPGTETFYFTPGGTVKHPVTEEIMNPSPPGPSGQNISTNADPRHELVKWLVAPGNPYFARAAVNRVWASFFGRGFVEPVDDFRSSNPVVNEPLLNALAADFASAGFDFKHLMRVILSSRLYQLSSTPNEFNLSDTKNFSRSYRRRLPAEVLLDAVNDITEVPEEYSGSPPGTRAMQTWSYKVGSQFMDAFGRPNPSSDCPCDRTARPSVVQSLHMMNARGLHAKLTDGRGRVQRLARSSNPPDEMVTELYLASYNRFPTAEELTRATEIYSQEKVTRATATEDVLWALLNSAEFVFNH